jgi:protein SCO1/2
MVRLTHIAALTLGAALLAAPAGAQQKPADPAADAQAKILKNVRLDQRLNAQVPLDVTFRDETGRTVALREYFGRKPVMLNLIQYRCTMLCSEEMHVLADSLKQLKFTAGDQFTLVTLSIDDREQPDLAAEYKRGYVEQYGRPGAAAGWHFLTGDKASIRRLADAIGYHFTYDARTDQFAHPDGVIVLTPEGKVARYFFRLEYPPRDLRFALIEAADRKIGTPIDALSLLCYHYNPVTGKYALAVLTLVRTASLATVALLLAGIVFMTWRGGRPGSNVKRPPESGSLPERLNA